MRKQLVEIMIRITQSGGEQNNATKTSHLYKEFNVTINKFDDYKDNNDDNKLFTLKFENKTKQIYIKEFNGNDLNKIKKNWGFTNIKNKKLTETIVYCVSKYNNKHDISWNIINNNIKHELIIRINYEIGMISMVIQLNIPALMSDDDYLKNELKKTNKILNETRKELSATKQELSDTKNELKILKGLFNELKSDVILIKNEMKGKNIDGDSTHFKDKPMIKWNANDIKCIFFSILILIII